MNASALIAKLQEMVAAHGDLPVTLDVETQGPYKIEKVELGQGFNLTSGWDSTWDHDSPTFHIT